MRIEVLVLAALAVMANAAPAPEPQWPYRDAVAPYYYGYPGKTPYMYRSGDEDDERDETQGLSRQDLKVATPKDAAAAGSSVTVVEDDEKADGIRVVETGSAKPVAQSANIRPNNNQQDQQASSAPAASSSSSASGAQQPLAANANNGQTQASGQPLTVQQPGQQPPQAFPPARPAGRPRPQEEDEDEDEEEDDSEEDEAEEDADAEDEEEGEESNEDEEEDEEDEEDRKRNENVVSQSSPVASSNSESEEPQPISQIVPEQQPQSSIVNNNSEGSDEVQEQEVPVVPVIPEQSQSSVLSNKVSKNKVKNQNNQVVVPTQVKNQQRLKPAQVQIQGSNKVNKNPGAIEALVPGYVTDQGEVLVPVDTVTGSQPITIVPDPFSPPSRIVSGPRPIPQSAVPSTPSRQVPYWYRSSPAISNPFGQEASGPRQTLYSAVPPPGSIFTFDDDDDDDDDAIDNAGVIPAGNRLRQEEEDNEDDDEQDEESEEDDKPQNQVPKVPLAAVPASSGSGEDDEAEALAFVNSGRPISSSSGNRRPTPNAATSSSSASANKKPVTGAKNPEEGSSEEEVEDSEEEDVSQEDQEEDDVARFNNNNRGRMYVDEDYVSFPPSRSPTLFAVIQGQGFPSQQRQPPYSQSQIISSPNPSNPFQRYVVRVTPAQRHTSRPSGPYPIPQQQLYYRPYSSPSPPKRKVIPVASFDVSVEDTRPSGPAGPGSYFPGVDSDEEGETVIATGGPRPTPVSSYPFVYKVQGSLQGLRLPSGGPSSGPRPGLRPSRPSFAFYGASFEGPSSSEGRPRPGPYSGGNPYAAIAQALYGPYGGGPGGPGGPGPSPFHRRPRPPSGGPPSGGPPVIVRRKQPGRPPKPQLIAVYNPQGSSAGPKRPQRPQREPVEEEYYTFEVPETNHKLVSGSGSRPPQNNKRPTVHRKPTPVIHQKLVPEAEDEEESDETLVPPRGGPPTPQHTIQIIPQGTVRRRSKQLKPKKKSKKTSNSQSSNKKRFEPQEDQQDPLGLLSKINKSTKTKFH